MTFAVHVFDSLDSGVAIKAFKNYGIEVFYSQKFIDEVEGEHAYFSIGRRGFGVNMLLGDNIYEADFLIIHPADTMVNWPAVYRDLNIIFHKYSGELDCLGSGIAVQKLDIEVECKSIPPSNPAIVGEYGYKALYLEELNIKLHEVTRPGTAKPFTVVVHNATEKGDLYLFTDIYGSREWDMNRLECRFDYLFLQNLWHHLKLPGEWSMNLLKERTERCYPGKLAEGIVPEAEPIVYRKPIEAVALTIKRKYGTF